MVVAIALCFYNFACRIKSGFYKQRWWWTRESDSRDIFISVLWLCTKSCRLAKGRKSKLLGMKKRRIARKKKDESRLQYWISRNISIFLNVCHCRFILFIKILRLYTFQRSWCVYFYRKIVVNLICSQKLRLSTNAVL